MSLRLRSALCALLLPALLARTLPPLGLACRTGGPAAVDAVCDPDALLTGAQALALQALVRRVHTEAPHRCAGAAAPGYQLAIALVRRLEEGGSIEALAARAHDAWGVGRAACNDGLVLALALEDRELHLSTGRGVRAALSDQASQVVLERMHPLLRQGGTAGALGEAVLDLLSVLQAGGTEGSGGGAAEEPQRAHLIASAAAQLAASERWALALKLALLLAVLAAIAYAFYAQRKEAEAAAAQARVAERLRAVQRARAAAEAAPPEDDTPLAARMPTCPICLDDFIVPPPPGSVTTLRCRHRFHANCLDQWETTGVNRLCPMCRAPIHGGEGVAGAAGAPGAAAAGGGGGGVGGGGGGGGGGGFSRSSAASEWYTPGLAPGFAAQRHADDLAFLFRRLHYLHPQHAPLFEEVRQGPASRTTFFPPPVARPAAPAGAFARGGAGGFSSSVGRMGGGSSVGGGGRSSKW